MVDSASFKKTNAQTDGVTNMTARGLNGDKKIEMHFSKITHLSLFALFKISFKNFAKCVIVPLIFPTTTIVFTLFSDCILSAF